MAEESSHYGQHEGCSLCAVCRDLNAAFNQVFREPRWRYYGKRGALAGHPADVYCYSTEKINGHFQSWVYRYVRKTQTWKMVKPVKHSRRRDAKARALKLYNAQEVPA
jgi:hypothetical protein